MIISIKIYHKMSIPFTDGITQTDWKILNLILVPNFPKCFYYEQKIIYFALINKRAGRENQAS